MNYPINYNQYRALTYTGRVKFLVLHYTERNFSDTLPLLTSKFSAHYLVPDPTDKTYKHDKLEIFNLVDEKECAWHAGASSWEDFTNLNYTSIGIEIVSLGFDPKNTSKFFAYNEQQIEAVIQLCNNILSRHPAITPTHVVGHSDIAFTRKKGLGPKKIDPGPKFPWYQLYKEGIGAWYDKSTKEKYIAKFQKTMPEITDIQNQLKTYGYGIEITNQFDSQTQDCLKVFQMHFRPSKYDGQIDIETIAILNALIEKYRNRS